MDRNQSTIGSSNGYHNGTSNGHHIQSNGYHNGSSNGHQQTNGNGYHHVTNGHSNGYHSTSNNNEHHHDDDFESDISVPTGACTERCKLCCCSFLMTLLINFAMKACCYYN